MNVIRFSEDTIADRLLRCSALHFLSKPGVDRRNHSINLC